MKSTAARFLSILGLTRAPFGRIVSLFLLLVHTIGFGIASTSVFGQAVPSAPVAREGDYIAKNFRFNDGEVLPELRIHYRVLGHPHRGSRLRKEAFRDQGMEIWLAKISIDIRRQPTTIWLWID